MKDWLKATVQTLASKWEPIYFLLIFLLLWLQVSFFVANPSIVNSLHGPTASLAALERFIAFRLAHITTPIYIFPSLFLLFSRVNSSWSRKYFDILGIYTISRLVIQFIGLNLLLFTRSGIGVLLMTQLLFFIPFSLLIWGWIYWRINQLTPELSRPFFRLEHDGENPRAIDYFVASFSSIFSASISGIKGNCARARILILLHGFMIYDVMGLTLSRAVSLTIAS